MRCLGQNTLLENLDDVFGQDNETLTKSNVLSLIKQDMKEYCLTKIEEARYNNFAKSMGKACVGWCEEHPISDVT